MDTASRQLVLDLFESTCDLSPEDREAYLQRACPDQPELIQEVQSLISASIDAPSFFDRPAPEQLREHSSPSPMTGERVGEYVLDTLIASGGMGSVYRAHRLTDPEHVVAIKVINPYAITPEKIERFEREQRTLARLDHPNIAWFLDGGITDKGIPYLVMKHIHGEPITEYCASRGLSIPARLRLFRTVCAAVHFAHQNLIVHRDLKPSNILVEPDGTPRLLDFGIAKVLDPDADPALTTTAWRLFTPEYASPEQINGHTVTTASDIYSLGVLLYELLTGRMPYAITSSGVDAMARAICESDPPRPSMALTHETSQTPVKLGREIRGDLDAITLMCLRKEPHRRYSSAQQLRDDIQRHLDGMPVAAQPDTWAYRSGKFIRRHRTGLAAGMTVVLALVGGAASTAWQGHQTNLALQRADREAHKAKRVSAFLQDMLTSLDPGAPAHDKALRTLLRDAVTRLDAGELTPQPEVEMDVRCTIAEAYLELGDGDNAAVHIERARTLAETRQISAVDDARSLALQGRLSRSQGHLAEAADAYRAALQRLEGNNDDAVRASILNSLGILHKHRGQLDRAEELLREALDLRIVEWGPRHRNVATSQSNLAAVLRHLGRAAEAEALYRDALDQFSTELGPGHVRVAGCMNNLALLLRDQGRLDEAEPLLRAALDIRRAVFGDEHPAVGTGLHNLALVLRDLGAEADAERTYRQALTLRERLLGPRHPSVANTANNLAELLAAMGSFEEAETLCRRALEVRSAALPPGHRRVAASQLALGQILLATGRAAEAEGWVRDAAAALRSTYGDEHTLTMTARAVLGQVLVELARHAEALEIMRSIAEQDSGSSAWPARTSASVVALYEALGAPEEFADTIMRLHAADDE